MKILIIHTITLYKREAMTLKAFMEHIDLFDTYNSLEKIILLFKNCSWIWTFRQKVSNLEFFECSPLVLTILSHFFFFSHIFITLRATDYFQFVRQMTELVQRMMSIPGRQPHSIC